MAVTATEIGRLVTRLTGDGKQYFQMLKEARDRTKIFTQDAQGRWRNARGEFVSNQKMMEVAMGRTGRKLHKLGTQFKTVGKIVKKVGTGMRSFGRSLSLRVTAISAIMYS